MREENNNNPICPRCGGVMFENGEWEMDDGDEEYHECGQCGRSCWVKCTMSVRVTYSTSTGDDDEGEEE